MEGYQSTQNRAAETAAVINQFVPTMSIGAMTAAGLISQSLALGALAQARDDALAEYDIAASAENRGFLALQQLVLALPKMARAELDRNIAIEADLLEQLAAAFAIDPRSTELALRRGKKLVSALNKINGYLTGSTPPRAPIESAGQGVADLLAAIEAQAPLIQALEDRAADVTAARAALRTATSALDQLNKRFYEKLQSEARSNPTLKIALGQITTTTINLPATLSIRDVLQGGTDNRQILVNYVEGTYDESATNRLEWRLASNGSTTGGNFPEQVKADPAGNAIGPFASGQRIQLRTRVSNANGTTTGSVRTLTIA